MPKQEITIFFIHFVLFLFDLKSIKALFLLKKHKIKQIGVIIDEPLYRSSVDVKVKYKATKKAKVKLTNKDSLVNHFFL